MHEIISQSKNGQVFKCSSCNKIHIEYKNLNFNFDEEGFHHLVNYFLNLDGEYWERRNVNNDFRRKILVPINHENFHVLLNNKELLEMKELFGESFKILEKNKLKIAIINKPLFSDN